MVPESFAVKPTVKVPVWLTLLFALAGCEVIVGAVAGVSKVVTEAGVDSSESLYCEPPIAVTDTL